MKVLAKRGLYRPSLPNFLSPRKALVALDLRRISSSRDSLNRPSPPPLPREQQREFEELVRKAQAPLSQEAEKTAMHPDAGQPVQEEFQGEVNPITGEEGGPKTEPVKKWTEGDWSFKGRVSDF